MNQDKMSKVIHDVWKQENVETLLSTVGRPRQELLEEAMTGGRDNLKAMRTGTLKARL